MSVFGTHLVNITDFDLNLASQAATSVLAGIMNAGGTGAVRFFSGAPGVPFVSNTGTPAGTITGADYVLDVTVTQVAFDEFRLVASLEAAYSREIVRVESADFTGIADYQAAIDAVAAAFNPIGDVIEDWEVAKRDADPTVARMVTEGEFALQLDDADLRSGESAELTAQLRDCDGVALPNRALTFTSSGGDVTPASVTTQEDGTGGASLVAGDGTGAIVITSEFRFNKPSGQPNHAFQRVVARRDVEFWSARIEVREVVHTEETRDDEVTVADTVSTFEYTDYMRRDPEGETALSLSPNGILPTAWGRGETEARTLVTGDGYSRMTRSRISGSLTSPASSEFAFSYTSATPDDFHIASWPTMIAGDSETVETTCDAEGCRTDTTTGQIPSYPVVQWNFLNLPGIPGLPMTPVLKTSRFDASGCLVEFVYEQSIPVENGTYAQELTISLQRD